MLNGSDRLADTYPSILDRQLHRQRYPSSRYVDDIRIIAKSWEEANTMIEEVAEYHSRTRAYIVSRKNVGI